MRIVLQAYCNNGAYIVVDHQLSMVWFPDDLLNDAISNAPNHLGFALMMCRLFGDVRGRWDSLTLTCVVRDHLRGARPPGDVAATSETAPMISLVEVKHI